MVSVHKGENRSTVGRALRVPAGPAAPLPSDNELQVLPTTHDHGEALGNKTATVSVNPQSYELLLAQ